MKSMAMMVTMMMMVMSVGASTPAGDADCIQPLETLMDCLPYAQGKEAAPAPKCCSNMRLVYSSQKKCLCELMAASFTGSTSGLPSFNRTLALHMPSACSIDADPTRCPALLGIPANSPEAKQFDLSANVTSLSGDTPTGTSLSAGSSTVPTSTELGSSSSMPKNSGTHTTISWSPLFFFLSLFLFMH